MMTTMVMKCRRRRSRSPLRLLTSRLFESPMQVDGCVDDSVIINKSVDHFRQSYSCRNKFRADALFDQFNRLRSAYVGDLLSASRAVDTELVSKVVFDLHQGKAPDIVGLTGEYFSILPPVDLGTIDQTISTDNF